MKKASNCMLILALVFSHAMLAVVMFFYVKIYLKGIWGVYAPGAPDAWWLSPPFLLAIAVCLALACIFRCIAQKAHPEATKPRPNAASSLFVALTFVLSHSMVATIGATYALLLGYMEHQGFLARPGTEPILAFLWIIPFGVGIALCLGMAHLLRKR